MPTLVAEVSGLRRARKGDSVTSEATLAWALADSVSVCFAEHDNLSIYIAVGAGETYLAIGKMLDIAVRKRYPLPATLLSKLAVWLDCYVGDEYEPTIRGLINRAEPQTLNDTVPSGRGRRPSSSRIPTLSGPHRRVRAERDQRRRQIVSADTLDELDR